MKHRYITLQILIAAKMNGTNNSIKPVAIANPVPTHYIF